MIISIRLHSRYSHRPVGLVKNRLPQISVPVETVAHAEQNSQDHAQGNADKDDDHDRQLVANGRIRGGAPDDLAGQHAGQENNAHGGHAGDGRVKGRFKAVAKEGDQCFHLTGAGSEVIPVAVALLVYCPIKLYRFRKGVGFAQPIHASIYFTQVVWCPSTRYCVAKPLHCRYKRWLVPVLVRDSRLEKAWIKGHSAGTKGYRSGLYGQNYITTYCGDEATLLFSGAELTVSNEALREVKRVSH